MRLLLPPRLRAGGLHAVYSTSTTSGRTAFSAPWISVAIPRRAALTSAKDKNSLSEAQLGSLSGHVVLDHPPDTGVVFPGDLAHLGNRHRRGEGDEQRLEQQGESRPRTSPRDVDLVYPVLIATHPRQTSMHVGLVLKEVEMAPLLVLGVVHRTRLLPAAIDWAGETGTAGEIEVQIEATPFGVEICPRHFPRVLKSQRHLEQIEIA